jgi:release factor glutamine methyltransferase
VGTLGDLLRHACERLSSVSASARLDAEVLAAHALGLDRAALIVAASRPLTAIEQQRIESLIERRARGEPVAYLTGRREFWSLPLAVTPAVLIPRPETELLVERALAHIPSDAEASVADLGTGSGAIALAIAHERPRAQVTATDASPEALAIARANARSLGLARIEFIEGEWLAQLPESAFDVIVSNPPYIRADDPHLQQGDVRFEPHAALVAGADGLDAIRVIVRDARRHLRPGGWLLLEHGHDQNEAVAALLKQSGHGDIRLYRDLAGHGRVTEARSP